MSRNIIRSNNAIVAVQNSTTAFSTSNKNLKYHKLAQTFDYSIGYSRQRSKQIGSQDLSTDDIYNQPDVSLNISYILQRILTAMILLLLAIVSQSLII